MDVTPHGNDHSLFLLRDSQSYTWSLKIRLHLAERATCLIWSNYHFSDCGEYIMILPVSMFDILCSQNRIDMPASP